MREAMFGIGPERSVSWKEMRADKIILERNPTKHLEHFREMNDMRIAADPRDRRLLMRHSRFAPTAEVYEQDLPASLLEAVEKLGNW